MAQMAADQRILRARLSRCTMIVLLLSAAIAVIRMPELAPPCERPPAYELRVSAQREPVIRATYRPDGRALQIVPVLPGRIHCAGFET